MQTNFKQSLYAEYAKNFSGFQFGTEHAILNEDSNSDSRIRW